MTIQLILVYFYRLLPQTIEILNWALSSIRIIFTEVDQFSLQNFDPVLFEEPNIFISSNPHSRFVYLMDQVPVFSVLCYFLIDSYSKSFTTYVCSTIFEYNLTIQKKHLLEDSNTENRSYMNILEDSLIFLFTHSFPICKDFFSSLTKLFSQIRSIEDSTNDLLVSTNQEKFRFSKCLYHPNRYLTYYSKLLNSSLLCVTTIPNPPPDIPFQSGIHDFPKENYNYDSTQLNLHLSCESYASVAHFDLFPRFLQLSRNILTFFRDIFVSSHGISRQFLLNQIDETLLSAFSFIVLEIDHISFRNKLIIPPDYDTFSRDILSTVNYFLFSELFENSLQISFLENIGLGFSDWPLFVSDSLLFILSRMLFYHSKYPITSNDHFLLRFSTAFFDALESKILSTSQPLNEFEDVNLLHLQLFLFSYSFFPIFHKKSIFYRLILLIHHFVVHKISNISSVIVVSRLITLFEYFLFFFTEPPKILYNCISSSFSDNSAVFRTNDTPTSCLEQSFGLFIKDQKNSNQPISYPLPRFYHLFDRSTNQLKIDQNCLLALNEMYLHIPITYSEFYNDLLILSFNVDCFNESQSSLNSSLSSFYINYRYESISNIFLFIPCMKLVPFDSAIGSVPLDSYCNLFLNIQAQLFTEREILNRAILDFVLTEEGSIEEKFTYCINLTKTIYRPIDILYLTESFFNNIIDSNSLSEFHLLLLTTSFVLLLYENLLSLQNISFSTIPERNSLPLVLKAQINEKNNVTDDVLVPTLDDSPSGSHFDPNNSLNNPYNSELEHSEFGVSMKHFLLQDISMKFIPKLFSVLKLLSDSCSKSLVRHPSNLQHISLKILELCTAIPSIKDLTLFPSSCNVPLFDSCLSDSVNVIFNSFQNISLGCLDGLSLPGESFLKKRHSLRDILECYLHSLCLNKSNCLLPIYKHCISSILSLIKSLYKLSKDTDNLDEFYLDVSLFVHSAPFMSLPSGCSLDEVVPKHLFTSISSASTFNLMRKSYALIHNSDLRYFCNASKVLGVYYSIILRCVKDSKLNRILCEVVMSEPDLNFFIPFLFPIYPEFRSCLNSSIQTFADTLIFQKENHFDESNILISQLNEGPFLDQDRIFTWFNYAMLGYPGEDEKNIEARCDKLLVLANAISTGGTILNPSTCQFMLKTILPLGTNLLEYIQQLLAKSNIGLFII